MRNDRFNMTDMIFYTKYIKLHIYFLNVPTISKFPLRKENKFCDSIF